MSENASIARPYAKAAFETALKHDSLPAVSSLLSLMSNIVRDDKLALLIKDPRISDDKVADLIMEICADAIDQYGKNFLRVLAENHRLSLLPEIAVLFEHLKTEHEQTLDVHVASRYPLNENQEQQLTLALQKRFNKKVSLRFDIDETLLGGAVIRVGDDFVMDGSAKGKLSQLTTHLNVIT